MTNPSGLDIARSSQLRRPSFPGAMLAQPSKLSFPGSCLGTHCLGGFASCIEANRALIQQAEPARHSVPRQEPGKQMFEPGKQMFDEKFLKLLLFLQCFALYLCMAPSVEADISNDLNTNAVSLLRRECISCHGPEKQEANLRLDSRPSFIAGGDNGPVLANSISLSPSAKRSLLLERIEHEDPELLMPPKRRLSETDIAILRDWVNAGAPWCAEDSLSETTDSAMVKRGDARSDAKNPISVLYGGKRLDLWSLKPIRRSAIPAVKGISWCRNPIDCFVLAKWEREGRIPAPDASDGVLARRTSMDLIGMPPDFDQVQSFVLDESPDKYDRYIDRNLNSFSFGVHWARMWLDVVRYSDSNGFDWDELRPNAWRYRDYVVRSLNDDLPFDQFVEQQLAGDELLVGAPLDEGEQDCLIATGYLRLGPQDNAAGLFNEQDRARTELMSDLTETTAGALLGLTMSCCRCHDHKTDPLSQVDHYRMRAFFAACQYADDVAIDLKSEQEVIVDHNQRLDAEIELLQPSDKVESKKATEQMSLQEREQVEQAESKIESIKKLKRSFTKGLLMRDQGDTIKPIFVLSNGDHRTPKDPVEPGFPSVLFPNAPDMAKPVKSNSTGRRLTLARWITSQENPWTARVIVNRIWQNYFGTGIVATPNDFGVTGELPMHPELLDYLAMELIESGWSLKHIHKLVVSSSAYRQRTIADEEANVDRKYETLRTHLRRMSAEQLRDSILHVSGLLQERGGGPPVWPVLDAETLAANPAVLDDNATKTKGWYPSPPSDQAARSLYLIQKRTIRIPWMETFDLPENVVSCGRRESSLVAPQSLAMMNGSLTLQASQRLAEAIMIDKELPRNDQVHQVFQRILLRTPNKQELDSCKLFLESRTLVELCMVLLNTNEFAFME